MPALPATVRRPRQPATERLDRDRQAAPQVFERLREMILSLALPPGSGLSRAALAQQFGVSSTPIRDALMRLDKEGLVQIFPQFATVVSKIDVGLAQEAHFLRQALELEIVRGLAQDRSEPLARELNLIIGRQQRFARDADFEKFMTADTEFHRTLYAAANKVGLWTLVRSQSGHIDRLRRLHLPSGGKAQAIIRDHKAIAKAIAAGRPGEAQDCLRLHLSGTLRDIDQIRTGYPEYLTS
jgi:DNA-binding GntR family transcriptional regulator